MHGEQSPYEVMSMKSNSVAHIYMKFITSSHNQTMRATGIDIYDANRMNPNPLNLADLSMVPNRTSITLDNNSTVVDYTITAKNNLKGIYAISLRWCGLSPFVVGLNSSQIDPAILHKFSTAVYNCPAFPLIVSEDLIGTSGITTLIASENQTISSKKVNIPTNSSQTQNLTNALPPLKQFKSVVKAPRIQCKKDFELMIRNGNTGPACVTHESAAKFVERGWRILSCCITIPLGPREPYDVGVNSRTDTVYVGDTGANKVWVIYGKTNEVIKTIPVGNVVFGIGVNLKTNLIYVVNAGDDTVSVIDGKTNEVINTIPVGTNPIGIGVNIKTNLIYVANLNSDSVSVIDGRTNSVINTISVDGAPHALAVNPKTNMVYVTNSAGPTMFVIDGKTNSVVRTIKGDSQEYSIAVNPRNNMIYVASAGGGVRVINGSTNSVVSSIEVGNVPLGIGVDYTTNLIYVANAGNKTVSVIDGNINNVVKTIILPRVGPNGIGVNPIMDKIYVTTVDGHTVLVISG